MKNKKYIINSINLDVDSYDMIIKFSNENDVSWEEAVNRLIKLGTAAFNIYKSNSDIENIVDKNKKGEVIKIRYKYEKK